MKMPPLLELNLFRADLDCGVGSAERAWTKIIEVVESLPIGEDKQQWMLSCYEKIKELARKSWTFDQDQALAFEALYNGKCNCSCGTQLLLCLAEWRGLLGEFGEAKWKDHTTLAHKRGDDVWILETTNRAPVWKPIEEVKKCHFQTTFELKLIFLSSMAELARKRKGRKMIIEKSFGHFPEQFWLANGGELAWICWRWVTSSPAWKGKAWSLVEQALQLLQPEVGALLEKRAMIILWVTAPPFCRAAMGKKITQLNQTLNEKCPN